MIKGLLNQPKIWLELDECELLFKKFHSFLDFDEPIPPFDTRFPGKLEAVLGAVCQTLDGKYLYSTIIDALVAYLVMINRSHPFQNGNKRMSVLFSNVFLIQNGYDFTLTNDRMFNLAITIATAGEWGIENDVLKDFVRDYIKDKIKKLY